MIDFQITSVNINTAKNTPHHITKNKCSFKINPKFLGFVCLSVFVLRNYITQAGDEVTLPLTQFAEYMVSLYILPWLTFTEIKRVIFYAGGTSLFPSALFGLHFL